MKTKVKPTVDKWESKIFYADILLQYKDLIPEVVCENCQSADDLVKSDKNDTGWYCQACDGMEVNYQRDSFVEDVLGSDKEANEELRIAVTKSLQEAKAERDREIVEKIKSGVLSYFDINHIFTVGSSLSTKDRADLVDSLVIKSLLSTTNTKSLEVNKGEK